MRLPSTPWVLATAAVAGAGTLVVELGAVRMLAPWFGASSLVWTHVIGVVLLALALGYLAGARLARGAAPGRSLGRVLLLGGLAAAGLPALAGPVCSRLLPDGLSLEQAAALWSWGSLAAALLLFSAPALLLGAVGPLCAECLQRARGGGAGEAGGYVLAASTLGSLAGAFATTHVLLPEVGLSLSFAGAGAILAVLGAVLELRSGGRAPPLAGLILAAAALGAARLRPPSLPPHLHLLAQVESSYQSLRVVEDRSVDPPWRLLQVNEGLDSFQSVWAPHKGLLGAGFYYDYFVLPAWWTSWADSNRRFRVLVLGLGAGTAFRVLEGASPPGLALDLWGIELDGRIVALAERWFDLDPAQAGRTVLAGQDAREALRRLPSDFDLAILDAYARQVEIPAHLSSLEFFREVRAHLAPGGWLAANVGGFGPDDPVVAAVGRTMASAFEGSALGLRVPRSRNWVLYARAGGYLPRPPLLAPEPVLGAEGGDLPAATFGWWGKHDVLEALLKPLQVPGSSVLFTPSSPGALLTDDRSAMEILQWRSLERGHARALGEG